jgi:hypothetical protein
MLEIMGADRLITIRGETGSGPGPAGETDEPPEVSLEPPGL